MSRQSRFDARYWMLGAGALGPPRGMVWGGRREGGSGWGTHVYLWQIHVDIWQNQYNIVKLKNKIKLKKKESSCFTMHWVSLVLGHLLIITTVPSILQTHFTDLMNVSLIHQSFGTVMNEEDEGASSEPLQTFFFEFHLTSVL